MKKTYSTPDIIFDNFSLSTNVAAVCEFKTPLPKVEQCGMPTGYFNSILFMNELQGCNKTPQPEEFDAICYHQPSETNNLFNS